MSNKCTYLLNLLKWNKESCDIDPVKIDVT